MYGSQAELKELMGQYNETRASEAAAQEAIITLQGQLETAKNQVNTPHPCARTHVRCQSARAWDVS